MKKLLAALFTFALIFSPVGNVVFQDHPTIVEAKSYKSGKKSFNLNKNTTTNSSNFQDKKANTPKNQSAASKGTFSSGGFFKGLMLGGLAGLLFGGLLTNMGIFGSILGLFINLLAIVILISIIRKIFVLIKHKKEKEAANPWKS